MLRHIIYWFAVVGASMALTSCGYLSPPLAFDPNADRQPVECTQILDDRLLRFPFGQLGLEKTELWDPRYLWGRAGKGSVDYRCFLSALE